MDKLTEAVASAEKQGHRLALLYMDLDRFKEINDSLGHAAGDELLRILAQRLRQSLAGGKGPSDQEGARPHMARFGGDEFAFLIPKVLTPEDAGRVAERVLELTSQSMELSGQSVCSSGSIGVAIYPQDGDDVETLTKHADVALYHAKRQHRSTHQFFSEDMIVCSERKSLIERHLRSAIENDELKLHYQPKVDIAEGEVVGAEALLRWECSELGSVAPKEFIPIAEDSGLIVPIGSWVIDSACRQIRGWLDAGYNPVPVSVNVSSIQLARSNVYATLTECLRYYDLSPNLLEVELTESTLLADDEDTATCLRDLRAIGVRVALDDFGTGYSALSYLGRFPLDILKMDRSFVRDIDSDPAAAGIARAVISMAHSLDLEVVAEGVDTEEQVPLLREMGCDQIQGFIYGPAVSRKRFGRHLPKGEQRVRVEIVGSDAECPAPLPGAAAITAPAGVADRNEPAAREAPAALPEKAEVEKAEAEKAEVEKAEAEKAEAEKAEAEKAEAEKAEVEKAEAEKAEAEKAEAEKAEAEKAEAREGGGREGGAREGGGRVGRPIRAHRRRRDRVARAGGAAPEPHRGVGLLRARCGRGVPVRHGGGREDPGAGRFAQCLPGEGLAGRATRGCGSGRRHLLHHRDRRRHRCGGTRAGRRRRARLGTAPARRRLGALLRRQRGPGASLGDRGRAQASGPRRSGGLDPRRRRARLRHPDLPLGAGRLRRDERATQRRYPVRAGVRARREAADRQREGRVRKARGPGGPAWRRRGDRRGLLRRPSRDRTEIARGRGGAFRQLSGLTRRCLAGEADA
jgi:diguanylate cyclase (GGDEF)-like protein